MRQTLTVGDKFGFYGILTDPVCGYEELARLWVDHKVRFIQLRMKRAEPVERLRMAEKIRRITEGTQSLFIMNDYPEVARDAGADGVHLGQDDTTLQEAVRIMGPDRIIGLSTHNPEQTRAACLAGPSYIGVGPVYKTPTKVIADPVIGLSGMKTMLEAATVPAIAIGAIHEGNLREVIRAGAVNFCSVRPLCSSLEPEKALVNLLSIWREEMDRRGL